MNFSMTLTLDGLVRTLRRVAHDLADDADHGYFSKRVRDGDSKQADGRTARAPARMPTGVDDHDRAGR
jgi:hypothetical protein